MGYEPKVIADLGDGWTLRRWEYDGAPIELHGPRVQLDLEATYLEIEVDDGDATLYRRVPLDKLRRLLAEAQSDAGEGT